MLRPEFERLDDGREWRELCRRFTEGFGRLLIATDGVLRQWDAAAARVQLRMALEQLQGAGYYLKSLSSGLLVDPHAERTLLLSAQAVHRTSVTVAGKLVALLPAGIPPGL